jgi:hypothetical protein
MIPNWRVIILDVGGRTANCLRIASIPIDWMRAEVAFQTHPIRCMTRADASPSLMVPCLLH